MTSVYEVRDDRWKKIQQLKECLEEVRDVLTDHGAYADLTEEEEIDEGGDTATFSYLVRTINEALKCTQ